ncbi:MAG TPA: hypothetical protein PKJ95_02610 [Atribacterota bacterium]|nr:hypothetical protein [Atribacterota bacterium]
MTQLTLFPPPTYAELCREEAKVFFRCVVCFKKRKRGTGIKDKFCSEKHERIYQKWEEELEEVKRRIEG